MIEVKRFVVNMLQENCYVVSDETKECVIIDCGAFYPEERQAIVSYINDNGLKPKHLLATHGHLDHLFGNNTIYDAFKLQVEVSERDENLVNGIVKQARKFYDMDLDRLLTCFPNVGDKTIAQWRGFASVEEHDALLLAGLARLHLATRCSRVLSAGLTWEAVR